MRKVSLNYRLLLDGVDIDAVETVLIHITHPETNEVIRLSTDPTERISADPLAYGTRSTWMGSDPETEPFLFVLVSVMVPDDQQDVPGGGNVILEAVDNEITALLRSTTREAEVSIAVVLSNAPDVIEAEFTKLKLVDSTGQNWQIPLTLSRDSMANQPWPAGRMTRERFPGLHP